MQDSTKLFLLICAFATVSLLILQTIYPQLVVAQLSAFLIGLAAFILVGHIPFEFWRAVAPYIFGVIVVLLLGTYVLGKTTKGSTRWISFGVSQVQPSQFAKPALALILAMLAFRQAQRTKFEHSLWLVSIAGLPTALVFFQPDLGTSIVMGAMSLAIFVFWGMPRRYFALFGVAFAVLAVIGWFFILKPYQKERVYTLINPTNNLSTSGYNALQSQIAVGSGKLMGRGLGQGVQSELRFLPERQTDFFFASLSEQLGFVGNIIVLTLYASLFYVLDQIIRKTRGKEGILYSFAILAMLCTQFSINVGMNIGILPITGITLPLLSYGGSSILAICVSLGLVISALRAGTPRRQVEIRSFL